MAERTWLSVGIVALCALGTVAISDVLLQRVSPIVWRRQVDDGVHDFRDGNPSVLSIASSHGRSMDVVGRVLGERTGQPGRMVSVSMEAGKAIHYEYILDERLKPFIEQTRADGSLVHDRLKRFVLVTDWGDSCSWPPGRRAVELPSHAWEFHHYLADVAQEGANSINRNYPRWHWKRMFQFSLLATDRGRGAVVPNLLATAVGRPTGRNAEEEKAFLEAWHQDLENGANCIFGAEQMASFRHIIGYFKARHVDVTILLFVRKPGTVTQKARETTLARFSAGMKEFAREQGVRLVDITEGTPLTDNDFMADYDHVSPAGNEILAPWLLDGKLSFLACDPGQSCEAHAGGTP
jgi:hypothetical protein